MRPRPRQEQLRLVRTVNQHPVRLDMQVAVAEPSALERVVAVAWFERLLRYQQQDDGPKSGHVLAALFRPLDILPERA